MDLTVGTIVDGKVKSITKFGAFVALPDNRTGMVHISEIAHAYVSDIREHLTEGQEVKVLVISVDPVGKINLSIKRTQEPPVAAARPACPRPSFDRPKPQFDRPKPQFDRPARPGGYDGRRSAAPSGPATFDDMVKQFMTDSDTKISTLKQYTDHKSKRRR